MMSSLGCFCECGWINLRVGRARKLSRKHYIWCVMGDQDTTSSVPPRFRKRRAAAGDDCGRESMGLRAGLNSRGSVGARPRVQRLGGRFGRDARVAQRFSALAAVSNCYRKDLQLCTSGAAGTRRCRKKVLRPAQKSLQAGPVKSCTRVCLARRRDVFVPRNMLDGIALDDV